MGPNTQPELAGYQLGYGTSSGQYTKVVDLGNVTTYTVSSLAAGTYYFAVRSYGSAGQQSIYSKEVTATVAGVSDTAPPLISSVAASSITSSGATIRWTTNEAADSQVKYGASTSYGSTTALNSTRVTAHSVTLTGLAASTTYHYQVLSRDAAGNLSSSGDFTFKTAAPADTTPPAISAVAASSITHSGATIRWTTNELADSQVDYDLTALLGHSTTRNTALVTAHSQTLIGLTAGTKYYYRVRSRDAAGNETVSGSYTFSTTASTDIASGLVAAYGFDEGTGDKSADASGSGNTAAIYSAGWRTGKYGNALYFSGIQSYVSAGTRALPEVNQPKTVSYWFYQTSLTTSSESMVSLGNLSKQAGLKHGTKASQAGVLNHSDTWIVVASSPSRWNWHHFAYVFDGSQSRLYIDGILNGTSNITPPAAPVTNFEIGRWITGSQYFRGIIDELRIYNRALSLADITALMATPVTKASAAALASLDIEDAEESATPNLSEEGGVNEDLIPLTATDVDIDIHLERQTYRPGQTVKADAYQISNRSQQIREVELKTWLVIPGQQPISLGNTSPDGILTLEPGLDHDYGNAGSFRVSRDAEEGTCEYNARLIDPVTGDILAQDINFFSILGSAPTGSPSSISSPNVVLENSAGDSGDQFILSNHGTESAEIELKIWLEIPRRNPVAVFSAGADGSLILSPGAVLGINPLASCQAPAGAYLLKSRIFNAVTGETLFEDEKEVSFE